MNFKVLFFIALTIFIFISCSRSPSSGIVKTDGQLQKEEFMATPEFIELSRIYLGIKLFRKHCYQCHSRSGRSCIRAGKPLDGVEERMPSSKDYFINYVLNSDSLIKAGDLYANKIHQDSMPKYTGVLTYDQVTCIYEFIVDKRYTRH